MSAIHRRAFTLLTCMFLLAICIVLFPVSSSAQETTDSKTDLRFREVAENQSTDPQIQQVLARIAKHQAKKSGSTTNSQDAFPTSITLQCGGTAPKSVIMTGDLMAPTSHENDKADAPIIALDQEGTPSVLCPAVLDGSVIEDATKQIDYLGNLSVGLELTVQGSIDFTRLIGVPLGNQSVAIVFKSLILSAPTIQPSLADGLTDNRLQITIGDENNQEQEVDELLDVLSPNGDIETNDERKSPLYSFDRDKKGFELPWNLSWLVVISFIFLTGALFLLIFGWVRSNRNKLNSENSELPVGEDPFHLNSFDSIPDTDTPKRDFP